MHMDDEQFMRDLDVLIDGVQKMQAELDSIFDHSSDLHLTDEFLKDLAPDPLLSEMRVSRVIRWPETLVYEIEITDAMHNVGVIALNKDTMHILADYLNAELEKHNG